MAEAARHSKGSVNSQPLITSFFQKQCRNDSMLENKSEMVQSDATKIEHDNEPGEKVARDGPALDADLVAVGGSLQDERQGHSSQKQRLGEESYLDHPTHPLSGKLGPLAIKSPRDSLLQYITRPEQNPEGRVVYYTNKWVFIKDKFPKGRVHFLLMSRDVEYFRSHPFSAFKDEAFLQEAKQEVHQAIRVAASELRHKVGKYSAAEKIRIEAMMADEEPEQLPQGRDWESEIMVGTHSWPSMTHLHIHVLSKDLSGEYMKSKHHYNNFATQFFVGLDEYPLADDDPRWHVEECHYLIKDAVCWRCGRNFGKSWKAFRAHLTKEFEEWKHD